MRGAPWAQVGPNFETANNWLMMTWGHLTTAIYKAYDEDPEKKNQFTQTSVAGSSLEEMRVLMGANVSEVQVQVYKYTYKYKRIY